MFENFLTFPVRLLGFLFTFPLRVLFDIDFDWGIR